MVIKTFNSKIFIRTCNGAPLYLGTLPFFRPWDQTSPLTFSSSRSPKCRWNRATDSPSTRSWYRFSAILFHRVLLWTFASSCLWIALDSSVFQTGTICEEFSLSLSASSTWCRIFALPLYHRSHSQFLIVHHQQRAPTIFPLYRSSYLSSQYRCYLTYS